MAYSMEMMAGQFKWNADRSCVCKEEEVAEETRQYAKLSN